MSKTLVRCRCGHHVVGREVLRLEPYERASGEEVVYVKYRCRHCKQMGEEFISRLEWDPSILDQNAISSSDLLSFHRALQRMQTLSDLARPERARKSSKKGGDKPSPAPKNGKSNP